MKILIFISLIILSQQKCNFQNEFPSEEVNKLKLNMTLKSHPFTIHYDYSAMDIQLKRNKVKVNHQYIKLIKEQLNIAKNIFKELLISPLTLTIKTKDDEICGERVKYGNTIIDGIKAEK